MTSSLPTGSGSSTQCRLDSPSLDPERHVCGCFHSITYTKYLHHVDVNKATDDPQLFSALRQKYSQWKPIWRRILTFEHSQELSIFKYEEQLPIAQSLRLLMLA